MSFQNQRYKPPYHFYPYGRGAAKYLMNGNYNPYYHYISRRKKRKNKNYQKYRKTYRGRNYGKYKSYNYKQYRYKPIQYQSENPWENKKYHPKRYYPKYDKKEEKEENLNIYIEGRPSYWSWYKKGEKNNPKKYNKNNKK